MARKARIAADTKKKKESEEKQSKIEGDKGVGRGGKRKRAVKGRLTETIKKKTIKGVEEGKGRGRKKKFLQGVTVREFLSFYEQFYELTYGEEPEWRWQINKYRDDERMVTTVISLAKNDVEDDLIELLENEFFETVEYWCRVSHKITLELRATNLFDYDQIPDVWKKILAENMSTFRSWYYRLYRLTYIEEEMRVQEERFLLNYTKKVQDNDDKEITVEDIDLLVERAALKEMKEILGSRQKAIDRRLKKKDKVWPVDYKWWINYPDASLTSRRFRYFEPLLIELYKLILPYPKSKELNVKHRLEPPEKNRIWAVIDLSRIQHVLNVNGIPPKTYVKYRSGFFKCGILKKLKKTKDGPALIAIGTYRDLEKHPTASPQLSRFLKSDTRGMISRFKL